MNKSPTNSEIQWALGFTLEEDSSYLKNEVKYVISEIKKIIKYLDIKEPTEITDVYTNFLKILDTVKNNIKKKLLINDTIKQMDDLCLIKKFNNQSVSIANTKYKI
jgi:hypothetical protein